MDRQSRCQRAAVRVLWRVVRVRPTPLVGRPLTMPLSLLGRADGVIGDASAPCPFLKAGFLRLRATAWWSWSDSNQPPECYGMWGCPTSSPCRTPSTSSVSLVNVATAEFRKTHVVVMRTRYVRPKEISMRKIDGWQTLATKLIDQPIDLAA